MAWGRGSNGFGERCSILSGVVQSADRCIVDILYYKIPFGEARAIIPIDSMQASSLKEQRLFAYSIVGCMKYAMGFLPSV